MTVSRVRKVLGSLVALATLATAGCSSSGSKGTADANTLRISVWGVTEDIASIKGAAAGFQKANPSIKLDFRVGDCGADYAACKTLIAGKNMSDVLVTGTWNFNQMVNDGVLADLSPHMETDGVKAADFTPVALGSDKAAKDGKYHALPMGYNVQSLFYNKTMFEKAGLAVPPADGNYTYDQLRTWAKKLTLDNKGRNPDDPAFDPKHIAQWGYYNRVAIPSDSGYSPVLWANGGGVLGGANRATCQLEDPATIDSFQMLQDMMWKDHSTLTPQQEQETPGYLRWIQGHVAMQQGSHEQVTIAAKQNPKMSYDMAAPPKGKAGSATLVQVHSWAVYQGSANQDNAWKFVKYMATEGSGKQMGLIPAYKDTAKGPDFAQAPGEPKNLVKAQLDPAAWPLTRTNVDPKGVMSQVQGQDGIAPAITSIIANKATAAAALKGTCAKVTKLLGS